MNIRAKESIHQSSVIDINQDLVYNRQVKHRYIISRCGFIIYCLVIFILGSCQDRSQKNLLNEERRITDSIASANKNEDAFRVLDSEPEKVRLPANKNEDSLRALDTIQTVQAHNHIATKKQNRFDAERSQRLTFFIGLLALLSIVCIVIIMLVYIIRLRSQRNRLIRQVEKMRTGSFTSITHEYRKPLHADELNVRVEKLLEQRRILQTECTKVTHEKTSREEDVSVITESDKHFLTKVTDAIKDQISSGKIDYDLLASTLCLSRAHLNRKIKAITGETTTDLILKIKISLAKNLLDNTDKSIIEITMDCGMDSDSYFCTLFKKATGQTPLQYRNRKNG